MSNSNAPTPQLTLVLHLLQIILQIPLLDPPPPPPALAFAVDPPHGDLGVLIAPEGKLSL